MITVGIDPGVHECAWARAVNGLVVAVDFDVAQYTWPDVSGGFDVDLVVLEVPQFDGRVDVHVISLAVQGALLAGALRPGTMRCLEPRQWKGSVPKPAHHRLIWRALTPAERALFPANTDTRIRTAQEKGAKDCWKRPGGYYYGKAKGSEVHNLLDAVGLVLFDAGRIPGPRKGKA